MTIFEFDDYKEYVNSWISNQSNRGRGQFKRIASYLKVHSTMVSHIFRGDLDISLENACVLAEYIGLNELETEYFFNMVQISRAGTVKLRKRLIKRRKQLKGLTIKVINRLPSENIISDENLGHFYSSWHYSAIRLLSTLTQYQDIATISSMIGLSNKQMNEAIDFLVDAGICIKEENLLKSKQSVTHLGSDSPYIWQHHTNWRKKAMERHVKLEEDELIFSAPLTIAKNDIPKVREKLVQIIEEISKVVKNTSPDTLACLNIDWIQLVSKPEDG